MPKNSDTNSLLSSIKELYSKLAIVMHEFRRNTFNKLYHSNINTNIISELNSHITELVAKAEPSTVKEDNIKVSYRDQSQNIRDKDDSHNQEDNNIHVKNIENELSKYLKSNQKSSSAHPGITEKLADSIWEHIHTALRVARNGNNEKAILHMNIVEHALDELSHYMENNEYSQFVALIEQYLIKIKNE